MGEHLTCVFVNNGLLRKGEPELVQKVFRDNFHINLVYVDAENRFLEALKGVADPEEKRKAIGRVFVAIKDFVFDFIVGFIDEVIRPRQTRRKLIQALASLETKRDKNPPKKHGNIPL